MQGDVVKVIHGATGTVFAEFSYDAYGNLEVHADNLGEVIGAILIIAITPQLYRGYIYVPLGDNLCYYLGSRFYNPQLGRFLNADKHTDTGTGVNGTNMFTYCNNNPVIYIDPTGEAMNVIVKLFSIIVSIINVFKKFISNPDNIPKDPYEILNWNYIFRNLCFTKISSGYKEARSGGTIHKGIDIISNDPSISIFGAEILSPCTGTVVYTYSNHNSAGNYIVIKSDDKDPVSGKSLMIGFMHMKSPSTLSVGTRVSKGTVLGYVGSTGMSSGPHLHLNVWTDINDYWARENTIVNPQKYFPGISFTGRTSTKD